MSTIYYEAPLFFKSNVTDYKMRKLITHWNSEACNKLYASHSDMFKTFMLINVEFSNRLSISAGKAISNLRSPIKDTIKLNYRLFKDFTNIEQLKETYLHELAHILANRYYETPCGHNWKWVQIAKALGSTGKQFHSMEVNHLRPSHLKRVFEIYCPCKTHFVTRHTWNKVNTLSNSYSCTICKGKISCTK